jgi:O-antigen ligase
MDSFTLYSVGGVVVAVLAFIVLKKVIGLVFRLILAAIIVGAVVLGAWWYTKSDDTTDDRRPARPTRRAQDD